MATEARSGRYVTLRHAWPDNVDGRVWAAVKRAAMRRAYGLADESGRPVEVYAKQGYVVDVAHPETGESLDENPGRRRVPEKARARPKAVEDRRSKKSRSNPHDDRLRRNIERAQIVNPAGALSGGLWWFQFGAYGDTYVFVWDDYGMGVERALEEAADALAEHAPGIFHEVDYEAAAEELGIEWPPVDQEDEDRVREAAEVDMTHTESGWIPSWEWSVQEPRPGDDVYKIVWEKSIDEALDAGLIEDDEEIDRVNQKAEDLGLSARWE